MVELKNRFLHFFYLFQVIEGLELVGFGQFLIFILNQLQLPRDTALQPYRIKLESCNAMRFYWSATLASKDDGF